MKKKSASLALALILCLTFARGVEGPYAKTADRILEAGVRSQSGEVVAQALAQMGYTEDEDEYTAFGEWYGYPHGYWCDMFVSWCAEQAGVSKNTFPREASCTKHRQLFAAMDRYLPSAVRGGSYTPLQGDLVLFRSLETGITHHIGLVLYVEDGKVFTVEGNAPTRRWDYPPDVVSEAQDILAEALENGEETPYSGDAKPPDYVTCNFYDLTDPRIHGYAVPAYTSRTPLTLEGFVDLGRYSGAEEQIDAVVSAGLMGGTSSHTFSPGAGMSRGEFLQAVLTLCGLNGWKTGTPAFDGVSMDHPYYSAVMTARSAGLLPETGDNTFDPNIWIDRESAQYILSAACRHLGLGERTYAFTPGDLSSILTPYTTRGDIAQALYSFSRDAAAVRSRPARISP